MFFLKKFLSLFILPLPLSLILALMGLFLLWFSERKKAGKVLVSIGSLSLLLMSTGIIAKLLLVPLERQYPPVLTASTIAGQDGQPIKWIVVLGGGGSYNSQLPSTSLLSNASLARLIEGIRLQRQISGSKLILSEGDIFGSGAVAELMGTVAQDLGVRKDDLVLETQSQDTESQARLILPLVGNERFFLVTSASHMPRSMALFRKLSMNPVAAPTDFESGESWRPAGFFPSTTNLRKTDLAVHEYLGLAWAKLNGKI